MRSRAIAFAAVAATFCAVGATASAQTVGIGITRGGGLNQVGVGVASVVSAHAGGVQMRTQPMAGTQQYIPLVHEGELEFGLANAFQTYFAYTGTGISEGRKYDNIRIVATLVPFETAYFVRNESDIRSYADLKGRKVGYGYTSAPIIQLIVTGFLRNGGLSWDDVERVPVAALGQQWDLLRQGRIDVATAPTGAGPVRDLDATISGGVRFLSLDGSPEGLARLHETLPLVYIAEHTPEGGLPGVRTPINALGFDMLLWTHKGVPDDTVYRVVKAMYEHYEDLAETAPGLWQRFDKADMAKDQEMPFHPGAARYFKEAGLAG